MASILLMAAVLSAAQLATDLRNNGPRQAVAALVAGGDWPRTLRHIAGGAPDWIALVPALARGVSAGSPEAEQLGDALVQALPRAPGEVLALAETNRGPMFEIARLCGGPIAPESRRPWRADAREAVLSLPALAAGRARAQCLRQLAADAG